jgi:hypothetical protein
LESFGKFSAGSRIWVSDHLIWVSGGAEHHRTVPIRWQFLHWRILRGSQASQEPNLVPFADEDVIAPIRIGINDPEC